MRVSKVLNNNAVLIHDAQQQEQVVMGCGLGFQKRPGDLLDEQCIEKIFARQKTGPQTVLCDLLQRIPPALLAVCERIIGLAQRQFPSLQDHIYLALADHCHFAIERQRQGLTIRNAMLWDIRQLYPAEYALGLQAIALIAAELDCQLPADEAGFIALHLVNAQLSGDMQTTSQICSIMQEILQIVRLKTQCPLDENTLAFQRFVTHLKFFTRRLLHRQSLPPGNPELPAMVRNYYPQAWHCAKAIARQLETHGHPGLQDDEIMYLSLHIGKLQTGQ